MPHEQTKRNYPDIIGNPPGVDGVMFVTIRGIIRSYYEFNLSPIWKTNNGDSIITELVVGPTSRQNLTELRLFLDSNDLETVTISESNIPLR